MGFQSFDGWEKWNSDLIGLAIEYERNGYTLNMGWGFEIGHRTILFERGIGFDFSILK